MVYMAPMKSLCSEKFREWREKFETNLPHGAVKILELTGDSDWADVADIRAYNLILTTPEKWDTLTRRWKDHTGLVRMIKLVMIDEVHTINDSSRGHTLEAVVTRGLPGSIDNFALKIGLRFPTLRDVKVHTVKFALMSCI